MKTDGQRPRGRRSLLRGVALGLLALVAPGVASDAAQAQTATPAITQMQSVGWAGAQLAAGPDGNVWSLEQVGEERRLAVARYDASGRVSAVQSGDIWAFTDLAPLAGGGMGFVSGDEPSWRRPSRVSLNTTDAAGERIRSQTLPRAARLADAFAIAGDGSVWFADTCGNELFRWRSGARLATVRLPKASCAGPTEYSGSAEGKTSLAVGPDGAVWFVNSTQARVVRRDVRGKLREWRYPRGRDSYLGPTIVPDPRGAGAGFSDNAPDGTAAGLISRSGRLHALRSAGVPAFAPDGTLWLAGRGGLTAIAQDGTTTVRPLAGRRVGTALAIARDGAPWYLDGFVETPPSIDPYLGEVGFGTVADDALVGSTLTGPGGAPVSQWVEPLIRLVLGGDGALWTRTDRNWSSSTIVRIVPPGLGPARAPVARVTRTLARAGRVLTLQVGCAAERGRFCRGTVRLRGAAAPVAYVAPGQSSAAVRLTLDGKAAKRLRQRRAVRTTAQVASRGAAATARALVVRPR